MKKLSISLGLAAALIASPVLAQETKTEQPKVQKTASETSAPDKSKVQKNSEDKSELKKPAVDKPEVKKPAVDKSEIKKPGADNSTIKKSAIDKPEFKKPVVDKPEVKKPSADKSEVKKPALDKSELQKSALKKPLAGEPKGPGPDQFGQKRAEFEKHRGEIQKLMQEGRHEEARAKMEAIRKELGHSGPGKPGGPHGPFAAEGGVKPGAGHPGQAALLQRIDALEKSVQSLAKQLEAVGAELKRREP